MANNIRFIPTCVKILSVLLETAINKNIPGVLDSDRDIV